jgi:hypothetical protein
MQSERMRRDLTWLVAPSLQSGLAAVFVLLGASSLLCVSATRSELVLPASLRPLPNWLAGPFSGGGLELGLATLIVLVTVMFLAYALVTRNAHELPMRAVLGGIVAFHAIVLLAPPLFSGDIFSYAAYARMGALHDLNPYLTGPSETPLPALHLLIPSKWAATPTVYGPLFTALSYLLVPLSIAQTVVAYKAVAAASSLALVGLVWRAADLRGLSSVRAAALVGLNPVIVIFGVGGGHNDLLMLALLVAGVYVLLAERHFSGGALFAAATAVKLTGALIFPFAFAARIDGGNDLPRGRKLLLGTIVPSAAICAMAFAFFGTGPLALLGTLRDIQGQGGPHSIPGFLVTALGLPGLVPPLNAVMSLVFLWVVAILTWRVHSGRLDWINGAAWATVALLLTTGFLVPWYVAWLIPLAALSSDSRLLAVAVLLTGVGLTTL